MTLTHDDKDILIPLIKKKIDSYEWVKKNKEVKNMQTFDARVNSLKDLLERIING